MYSAVKTLSIIAASLGVADAAMGPYFSTGPTASGVYIQESTATLILPAAPSNNQGDLSLWVGMGTSFGDLIQSIADCYVRLSSFGDHCVFPVLTSLPAMHRFHLERLCLYAQGDQRCAAHFLRPELRRWQHRHFRNANTFCDVVADSQEVIEGPTHAASSSQQVTMHCECFTDTVLSCHDHYSP